MLSFVASHVKKFCFHTSEHVLLLGLGVVGTKCRCPDMLNILSEILRHCPNLRIVVSSQRGT